MKHLYGCASFGNLLKKMVIFHILENKVVDIKQCVPFLTHSNISTSLFNKLM